MNRPGKKETATLQVERVGDVTVIRIVGSMTADGLSGDLRSAAQKAVESDRANCILDVSEVEEFDASGLGEILAALAILSEEGGTLAVAQPSQGFRDFFHDTDYLTGPSRVFSSIDDAIEALRKGAGSFIPDTD